MVDTIAHGLLSFIIFRKFKPLKYIWLAIFFGVLPDLSSWTIYLTYGLFTGSFAHAGPTQLSSIPNWVFTLYGISHSLIVFGIVALAIFTVKRHIPGYLFAWPIHILIDIPTHSREFLPTPFLWPISDWAFPGIGWGNPYIFFTYWILILLFLIYIFVFERRNKKIKLRNNIK